MELSTWLETLLKGENFYTFHPVKLVTACCWFRDMHEHLEVYSGKKCIPLLLDTLLINLPSPDFRIVTEQNVSDQDRAIGHVLGGAHMINILANELISDTVSAYVAHNWMAFHPPIHFGVWE
jgi:hypothetical protein